MILERLRRATSIALTIGVVIFPSYAGAQQGSAELLAFVNTLYIHGLPIAEAQARFDVSDVPDLLALLDDPVEEKYLRNIVLMLGLVGDERATAALINLLDTAPAGPITHGRFKGLSLALPALGFLAGRGDADARQFLIARADPSAWSGNRLRWTLATAPTDYLPHYMAKMAIQGLSTASTPEADAVLQDLQSRVESGALPDHYRNDVSDAIGRSKRIKQSGVGAAFRRADGN
jgi:hypothetical protein